MDRYLTKKLERHSQKNKFLDKTGRSIRPTPSKEKLTKILLDKQDNKNNFSFLNNSNCSRMVRPKMVKVFDAIDNNCNYKSYNYFKILADISEEDRNTITKNPCISNYFEFEKLKNEDNLRKEEEKKRKEKERELKLELKKNEISSGKNEKAHFENLGESEIVSEAEEHRRDICKTNENLGNFLRSGKLTNFQKFVDVGIKFINDPAKMNNYQYLAKIEKKKMVLDGELEAYNIYVNHILEVIKEKNKKLRFDKKLTKRKNR